MVIGPILLLLASVNHRLVVVRPDSDALRTGGGVRQPVIRELSLAAGGHPGDAVTPVRIGSGSREQHPLESGQAKNVQGEKVEKMRNRRLHLTVVSTTTAFVIYAARRNGGSPATRLLYRRVPFGSAGVPA